MIFRTGSVLMVGKCSEEILTNIYKFIRYILETEYYNIYIDLFIVHVWNNSYTKHSYTSINFLNQNFTFSIKNILKVYKGFYEWYNNHARILLWMLRFHCKD